MNVRRTSLAVLAVTMLTVTVLAASCSSGSDESIDAAPNESVTAATEASTDDVAASDSEATAPADTAAPAETAPASTDAPTPTAPPLIEAADTFKLLTAPVELGTQPKLAWEAVVGAARYRVVVLDGEGLPYWAWSGEDTSVFLGGGASSEGAGPSVGAGFTWSVMAFDSEESFLAASALAPLAV